ncbi:MAG: trigger factor [Firmicutes bacterium]|nr:trigger factor [Bacillota bacterium]
MQTSSTTLEDYKIKLVVEVDEEEVKTAEEAAIRQLVREVRVPGFRPGKVPPRVLVQRLGHKAIRSEALRELIPKTYNEAIEIENIEAIDSPEIDIKEGEETGRLVYEATVAIRPIANIEGYENIKVEIPSPSATDEDIEHQIDHLREQLATLAEVDRESEVGDVITLDMKGVRDGKQIDDLSVEDFVYELGKGGLMEDADEILVGVRTGDDIEYDAKEAPGGEATIFFHIKAVREKVLPEADDEFAKDVSEFDTLQELRDDLIEQIGKQKLQFAETSFREKTLEQLIALLPIEAPEVMVKEATAKKLQTAISQIGQMGIKMNKYLEIMGQSEDEFIAEAEEVAKKEVLRDLALLAVAEKEKIIVDELELDNELVKMSEQMNVPITKVREIFDQQGRMNDLKMQKKIDKTFEWLLGTVELTDIEGHKLDKSIFQANDNEEDKQTSALNDSKKEEITSNSGNLDSEDTLQSDEEDSDVGGIEE